MAMRGLPREFELSVRVDGSSDVASAVRDPNGLAGSGSRHILLLVHGYNNSHDEAKASYQTFIGNIRDKLDDSRAAPDAIASFHWPGDESTVFGTTVGYPFDINHARDAASRLATFLVGVAQRGPPSLRVTMVGHSMGCRLILEALGTLARARNAPGIELVGLMAAASPVDFVKRTGRLFNTGNPPRRMLKFFSEQDMVLQIGFPLGQFLAYQYQIEDDNYDEAVGRHGHPDEYGSGIQTQNGHSDYWKDQTIVAIMVRQIDATAPREIAAPAMPERALPAASGMAGRELATRTLPS